MPFERVNQNWSDEEHIRSFKSMKKLLRKGKRDEKSKEYGNVGTGGLD